MLTLTGLQYFVIPPPGYGSYDPGTLTLAGLNVQGEKPASVPGFNMGPDSLVVHLLTVPPDFFGSQLCQKHG